MQSFLTSFCVSSNKKRRTSGHIFQGRFKAHLVDDELYRSRLSRYIHLNPIRIKALIDAGIEERYDYLREFKWSSYRSYIGLSKPAKWLDCTPILSCWGKRKREKMTNYAAYVEEGLLKNIENPFDDVVEQSIIGSDRFVDWVKREYLLMRDANKREDAALIHLQQSFDFDEIIQHVVEYFDIIEELILERKSGNRDARRIAMYLVCIYCRRHYSLSEMGARFSVTASALTQARGSIANNSSPGLKQMLLDLKDKISKTAS